MIEKQFEYAFKEILDFKVDMFKTPLFVFDLSNKKNINEINKQFKQFVLNEELLKNGRIVSNIGGFQTKLVGKDFLPFFNFVNNINEEINKVLLILNYKNVISVTPTQCWFNINRKGHINNLHTHSGSDLALVYYIDIPKNNIEGGSIIFNNPDYYTPMKDLKAESFNEYNSATYRYVPKKNNLLVFESHLQHFVEPNLTDDVRISMSFNLKISQNI